MINLLQHIKYYCDDSIYSLHTGRIILMVCQGFHRKIYRENAILLAQIIYTTINIFENSYFSEVILDSHKSLPCLWARFLRNRRHLVKTRSEG